MAALSVQNLGKECKDSQPRDLRLLFELRPQSLVPGHPAADEKRFRLEPVGRAEHVIEQRPDDGAFEAGQKIGQLGARPWKFSLRG